jgi:hypothetical protein
MLRTRLCALLGVAVIVLAPLAVSSPASAGSAPESNVTSWSCSVSGGRGTVVYRGRVLYSNTTRHRISIDRVTVDSAYQTPPGGTARRVALWDVSVVVLQQLPDVIRDGGTGPDWTGASATFFWPQKWVSAPTSNKVAVRVSSDVAVGSAWCQRELYFWG